MRRQVEMTEEQYNAIKSYAVSTGKTELELRNMAFNSGYQILKNAMDELSEVKRKLEKKND